MTETDIADGGGVLAGMLADHVTQSYVWSIGNATR